MAEAKRLEAEREERERRRQENEIQQIKDRHLKEKMQQISLTSHGQKILKKLDDEVKSRFFPIVIIIEIITGLEKNGCRANRS